MPGLAPTAPPLLAARGLAFARNEQPVFGPLDFVVDAGEALLVQGDNGSGKTTLLRVLAGLLRADAGEIDIDGQPTRAALRSRAISYLGHLPALKADLTALENLDFLCGLHGRRRGQLPGNALGIVGLSGHEDTLARQLSAGQKKRLSLARLWLAPAPLWLLDEPYANLDLDGINLVNRMVQAHLRDGGAALLTTHGAYAAPPVRTRMLELGAGPRQAEALSASAAAPNARPGKAGPDDPKVAE
jgi:heme exporter protein A